MSISNSIDTDTAACTNGALLPLFDLVSGEPASTNGGDNQEIWVVETCDAESVMVVAETSEVNVAANLQLIQDIVRTLRTP